MILENLINDYTQNSILLHNANDFAIKRKHIEKSNKIINKVYSNHMEQDFFNELFKSNEPFVLADIASDSLAMKFDIKKSYEIMKYLKDNASKLVFSSDPIVNKNAQTFYLNDDLLVYKNEVKLYEKINDNFLYHKFHEYWELLINHYNWYIGNKFAKESKKPWNVEIDNILNEIEKEGKLSKFFQITYEKFNSNENYISMTINAYYLWKYTNNKDESANMIKRVLNGNNIDVTPQLRQFASECLEKINKNDKCII